VLRALTEPGLVSAIFVAMDEPVRVIDLSKAPGESPMATRRSSLTSPKLADVGWTAQIGLEDDLRSTVRWYRADLLPLEETRARCWSYADPAPLPLPSPTLRFYLRAVRCAGVGQGIAGHVPGHHPPPYQGRP
jgi:hypothetical protein